MPPAPNPHILLQFERLRAQLELQAPEFPLGDKGGLDGNKRVVSWRGNPNSNVLVIGEGPGEKEAAAGMPFVGPSGRELDAIFDKVGLSAADKGNALITNLVHIQPPKNRDPHVNEIYAELGVTRRVIALQRPRLIIAVGRIAATIVKNGIKLPKSAISSMRRERKYGKSRAKMEKLRGAGNDMDSGGDICSEEDDEDDDDKDDDEDEDEEDEEDEEFEEDRWTHYDRIGLNHDPITKTHGNIGFVEIALPGGDVLPVWTMSIYHPSFILRASTSRAESLRFEWGQDLQRWSQWTQNPPSLNTIKWRQNDEAEWAEAKQWETSEGRVVFKCVEPHEIQTSAFMEYVYKRPVCLESRVNNANQVVFQPTAVEFDAVTDQFSFFGRDVHGRTLTCFVKNFLFQFYVRVDRDIEEGDLAGWKYGLEKDLEKESIIIQTRLMDVSKYSQFGFSTESIVGKNVDLVRVRYSSYSDKRHIAQSFANKFNVDPACDDSWFEINIKPQEQLMLANKLQGSGWFVVQLGSAETGVFDSRFTTSDYEVDVHDPCCLTGKTDVDYALSKELSYDSETTSLYPELGGAICICAVTQERDKNTKIDRKKGYSNTMDGYVFSLRAIEPMTVDEISTEMRKVSIFCFKSEKDLLHAWRQFQVVYNADIVTGYNTNKFDTWFTHRRAVLLGIPSANINGRVLGKKTVPRKMVFQNRGLGTRVLVDPCMSGVTHADALEIWMRTRSETDYTLNAVAAKELDDRKNDMPYEQITPMFNASLAARRKLNAYCLKDAELPLRLINKRDVIVQMHETARVCYTVFPEKVYTGGVQEKVFGAMNTMSHQDGHRYLMPVYGGIAGCDEESRGASNQMAIDSMFADSDNIQFLDEKKSGKAGYEGAVVLKPKEGFYPAGEPNYPRVNKEECNTQTGETAEQKEKRVHGLRNKIRAKIEALCKLKRGDDPLTRRRRGRPVSCFDVASLYPSIQKQYNISHETKVTLSKLCDDVEKELMERFGLRRDEVSIAETLTVDQPKGCKFGFVTHYAMGLRRAVEDETLYPEAFRLCARRETKKVIECTYAQLEKYGILQHAIRRDVEADNTPVVPERYVFVEEDAGRLAAVTGAPVFEATAVEHYLEVLEKNMKNNGKGVSKYVRDLMAECELCSRDGHLVSVYDLGWGFVPRTVRMLNAKRTWAKKMRDANEDNPVLYSIYDSMQIAIKVIANSVYGATGLERSKGRLADKDLGAAVTSWGRYWLLRIRGKVGASWGAEPGARTKYVDHTGFTEEERAMGSETVGGDSVTGDTSIIVRDPSTGLIDVVEIKSLCSEFSKRSEKEYGSTPLEVWSDKGFTKIRHVMRHSTAKTIIRVLTHRGCVDVTTDHGLLLNGPSHEQISPKTCVVGKTELLHVSFSRTHDVFNGCEFHGAELLPQEAWFLGAFLADGSAQTKQTKCGRGWWKVSKQDKEHLENCLKAISIFSDRRQIQLGFKIVDHLNSSSVYNLVAESRKTECAYGQLRDFIDVFRSEFYTTDGLKKIPKSILNGSTEVKQAFFDGYYAGDGSKKEGNRKRFDIKGKIGALGLYTICESIGYTCSISTRWDKPMIYRINTTKTPTRTHVSKPFAVKKLYEVANPGEHVYDLETENHHFHAGVGSMIVHNTDSFFQWFYFLYDAEEALEAGPWLVQWVNRLCPRHIRFTFEKTMTPWLAREKKKRYCGYLYSNDECGNAFAKKRWIELNVPADQWEQTFLDTDWPNMFGKDEWRGKLRALQGAVLKCKTLDELMARYVKKPRFSHPKLDMRNFAKLFAKGFEAVRRSEIQFLKEMQMHVIEIISNTGDGKAALEYVAGRKRKLFDGGVPIMHVTKSARISRAKYANEKSVPALVVAKQERKAGRREYAIGDRVPYVQIKGLPRMKKMERIAHPEQVMRDRRLQVDYAEVWNGAKDRIEPILKYVCTQDEMNSVLNSKVLVGSVSFLTPQDPLAAFFSKKEVCKACGKEACKGCSQDKIDARIRALDSEMDGWARKRSACHRKCADCSTVNIYDKIWCTASGCKDFEPRIRADIMFESTMAKRKEIAPIESAGVTVIASDVEQGVVEEALKRLSFDEWRGMDVQVAGNQKIDGFKWRKRDGIKEHVVLVFDNDEMHIEAKAAMQEEGSVIRKVLGFAKK